MKCAFFARLHVIFWAFALCLNVFRPVNAAEEIKFNQNKAYLNYPNSILFSVQIESSSAIDQVLLIYSTNAHTCISSNAQVEVPVSPKNNISAEWTWYLNNLPPGAEVAWQWKVRDTQGHSLITPEQKLLIEDNHYTWQRLQSGKITVHWNEGSANFGKQILNVASSSLARLEMNLGIIEPNPIRLIIYPSSGDLRAAVPNVPDWTGGIALPEYDAIMAGIDPQQPDYINEVIPHELAHLMIDQRIDNCVGSKLPTWLSEGLAVYAEGPTSKADQTLVAAALENKNGLDLRDLTIRFPADPEQAHLAYAQCGMIATYLVNTFGPTQLNLFLEQIKQGVSINPALQAVYHLDTVGIDQAWRASMSYSPTNPLLTPGSPTPKGQRTLVPTLDLFSTPTGALTPYSSSTPEKIAKITNTPQPGSTVSSITPTKSIQTAKSSATTEPPIWLWFVISAVFLIAAALFILFKARGSTPL